MMRVLVVDDVVAVASLHGRFIGAHPQCELVGTVGSGPHAVAAIAELAPDLVLLDVHLPGFSGLDALRAVRADARLVQPEVIALTAARDIDTVREARLLGVRHYLVKPFTAQELHGRIDAIIAEQANDPGPATSLDQRAVDAVMRPTPVGVLPKGLTAETLARVTEALVSRGSASAGDVAEVTGVSRVSCKRYLEHLADSGAAERTLDYSTSGRPSTRYSLVQ